MPTRTASPLTILFMWLYDLVFEVKTWAEKMVILKNTYLSIYLLSNYLLLKNTFRFHRGGRKGFKERLNSHVIERTTFSVSVPELFPCPGVMHWWKWPSPSQGSPHAGWPQRTSAWSPFPSGPTIPEGHVFLAPICATQNVCVHRNTILYMVTRYG